MIIKKIKVSLPNISEAIFRLTRRCNNNCPHCYINLPLTAKTKELSAKEWYKIIDQLAENGFNYLNLTGGEPTVYPGFKEIYLYAKKKGFALELATNATNFSEATKKLLLEYPPQAVTVTIYGIDDKTYSLVSGNKNGWKNFLKNIIFLSRLQKEKGVVLKFFSILTKDTIKFTDQINAFSTKYIKQNPYYIKTLFLRMDKDIARNKLINEKKISSKDLKTVSLGLDSKENSCFHLPIEKANVKNPRLFNCQVGQRKSIYFFENGKMSLCSIIEDPRYTLQLTKEDIENFDYKKSRETLDKKFAPLLELEINKKCAACNLRSYCYSCPAKNLLDNIEITSYNKETCLKNLQKLK